MKVGVIGFGYLGANLADKFNSLQLLDYLVIKNEKKRIEALEYFPKNINIYSNLEEIQNFCDFNIIAVNDSEISNIVNKISKFGNIENQFFVHCSGILDLNPLRELLQKGAIIASAHPYQTFWKRDLNNFNNISWLIDSNNGINKIQSLVKLIGGNPIKINELTDRNGYHLSAVIISNYMNLLFYLSKNIAEKSGIEPTDFMPQIAKTTLQNNLSNLHEKSAIPLTGPVARGDLNTIKLHLEFLKNHNQMLIPYIYLSLATLEIAKNNDLINFEKYNEIKIYLQNSISL